MIFRKPLLASVMGASLCIFAIGSMAFVQPAFAAPTEVKVIVNNNPITTGDIQKRAAFLKLQGQKGNLNAKAKDELVDEMLKRVEMKTRGINISQQEIDNAYASFANNNGMTVPQLDQIMNQAGVTPQHFKTYVMVQMGWGRAVSARFRSDGIVTEQQAVQRMKKDGGRKPVATEYTLQQVILVVPSAKRSPALMNKRRQEANALRNKFQNCGTTRQQTKGMIDVTVRDLGKFIEQEVPSEWTKDVKATASGRVTGTQDTERGIEFLAVCSTRQVSDDRVAQMVFSMEGTDTSKGQEAKADAISKKYMQDLREKARIVNR